MWLLTCLFLASYLQREKRGEAVLNYRLAFINAEPSPARMWCPALINSNEWNWRTHNRRAKAIRNWLKGNPSPESKRTSLSMGAGRKLLKGTVYFIRDTTIVSRREGQPVNFFTIFIHNPRLFFFQTIQFLLMFDDFKLFQF